jgi:predicted phosphodiesterase
VVSVAALYDIHGNTPALRAVLAELERSGVQRIVVGGDVAAGPAPRETIELLMAIEPCPVFVMGNADREIIEQFDAGRTDIDAEQDAPERWAAFAAARLERGQRDFLAGFAATVTLQIEGLGEVRFCHGTPRSDTEAITTATPDRRLRGLLADVREQVVVCGHTHRQFDRRVEGHRVINAGSVGLPYEGRRGAFWALLGPDVQLRRTEYDLERALAELRASGFPDTEEMLKESLLEPSDPDEVAELFERQAGA